MTFEPEPRRCPHCKGTRFHTITDATLEFSYSEYGQKEKFRLIDTGGMSQYMPVCSKCDTPVERSDLVR